MTDRRQLFLALGVFAVALIVRLIGIGWGLPNDQRNQSLHPDEPVIWAYSQLIEPTKGEFTPGFYNYGTLYLTLLRVSTDIVAGYGAGPENDTEKAAWRAVGRYHKAGRVISALAGAGTALFVFLILYRRVGQLGALFGAAVMSFAPGHVVHSRFQTVDVLATFFLVVSLWLALRIVKPDEGEGVNDKLYMKLAAWSGVFAGLSAGTKYTGILALVALFVVVLLDTRLLRWKALAFGIGAALLAFFISTPGALLDTAKFMEDFKYEMTHTQTGHGLVFAGTPSGFIYHFWNLFVSLGLFATVLGAAGLVRASFKRHSWAIALLAFALVYYILIGRAEVKFMRYVFPLIPVLAVGLGWIVSRAHISPKPAVRAIVMVCGIVAIGGLGGGAIGILGGGLSSTVLMTSWMMKPDNRDLAAEDIREAAQPGETVGFVSDPWFYSPPLYPNSGMLRSSPFQDRNTDMLAATEPSLLRYVPANPNERFDWDKRLLTDLEPDYVVWSSFELGDLGRIKQLPSPPVEYKILVERAEEFMDTLETGYEEWLVHPGGGPMLPHDLAYIRPSIEIWKKKTDSPSPSSGSSTTSEPNEEPANTP